MASPNANGRTARERLLSRLIADPSGCVLWTGQKNSRGYGRVKIGGHMRQVHRVVYEMFADPIPEGLTLDHLCRVRHCANVAHLEPVTSRVNTLRGISPPAVNVTKTHCPQGHPYEGANLRQYDSGRSCWVCNRDGRRRYYAQHAVEINRRRRLRRAGAARAAREAKS